MNNYAKERIANKQKLTDSKTQAATEVNISLVLWLFSTGIQNAKITPGGGGGRALRLFRTLCCDPPYFYRTLTCRKTVYLTLICRKTLAENA